MIISAGWHDTARAYERAVDIRHLTDVSGCNLQQYLPCNWLSWRAPGALAEVDSVLADAGEPDGATGGVRAGVRPVASAAAWPDRAENSVKWRGKPMKLGSTGEPE
jgi:hypothetical protein